MKTFGCIVFIFLWILPLGLWAEEGTSPKPIKVGQAAPEFTAKDDRGETIALSQFRGKTVILYFYPKDDTPGCTLEATQFRDTYPQFQQKNAVIIGVSYDDVASHQNFKNKFKLPFYLIVDGDKKISEAYGAKGDFFASRDTVVIGPDGLIEGIYRNVNPSTHAGEILKDLSQPEKSASPFPKGGNP